MRSFAAVVVACLAAPVAPAAACVPFVGPQRVPIVGYDDHAMEPFVAPDGRTLLFNNSNEDGRFTDLHYAVRTKHGFAYRGRVVGTSSPEIDAVPSLDRTGVLYFVSARSYGKTFSTIYRGTFKAGRVRDVKLVDGVSRKVPGFVNFDAEVSPDGNTLVYVDGFLIPGGPVPFHADLVMARRTKTGFARVRDSDDTLREINTPALEFAPALSPDGRELFFTRWMFVPGTAPQIYRAIRASTRGAFGTPTLLQGLGAFVEAPAVGPGGRWVYFHRRDAAGFRIYRVPRSC